MKLANWFGIIAFFSVGSCFAAQGLVFSGQSFHKFYQYTDPASGADKSAQDTLLFAQQKYDPSGSFSARAEVFAFVGDTLTDQEQSTDYQSRENSEIWPGSIYGQLTKGPMLLRVGFQQIFWQESFGMSYTNFINANDRRRSVFDPQVQTFRSLPAMNMKLSGDQLSAQFIYLPFSDYDRPMPYSRIGQADWPLLPGQQVRFNGPNGSKSTDDIGVRTSWAGDGFDFSLFYFKLKDRKLVYTISPASTTSLLVLDGDSKQISNFGATATLTIGDYIGHFEAVQFTKRRWNTISGLSLDVAELDETAITVGVDAPMSDKRAFSVQHSFSTLENEMPGLERKKTENVSYVFFEYSIKSDLRSKFMAAYLWSDQSFWERLSFVMPASKRVDFEIGHEGMFGDEQSVAGAYKNLNRIFLEASIVF